MFLLNTFLWFPTKVLFFYRPTKFSRTKSSKKRNHKINMRENNHFCVLFPHQELYFILNEWIRKCFYDKWKYSEKYFSMLFFLSRWNNYKFINSYSIDLQIVACHLKVCLSLFFLNLSFSDVLRKEVVGECRHWSELQCLEMLRIFSLVAKR